MDLIYVMCERDALGVWFTFLTPRPFFSLTQPVLFNLQQKLRKASHQRDPEHARKVWVWLFLTVIYKSSIAYSAPSHSHNRCKNQTLLQKKKQKDKSLCTVRPQLWRIYNYFQRRFLVHLAPNITCLFSAHINHTILIKTVCFFNKVVYYSHTLNMALSVVVGKINLVFCTGEVTKIFQTISPFPMLCCTGNKLDKDLA